MRWSWPGRRRTRAWWPVRRSRCGDRGGRGRRPAAAPAAMAAHVQHRRRGSPVSRPPVPPRRAGAAAQRTGAGQRPVAANSGQLVREPGLSAGRRAPFFAVRAGAGCASTALAARRVAPRRSPRSPPRSARPARRTAGRPPAPRGPFPPPRRQLAAPGPLPGTDRVHSVPRPVTGMPRLRARAVRLAAPAVVLAHRAPPEIPDLGQLLIQPCPARLHSAPQARLGHGHSSVWLFDRNQTRSLTCTDPPTYIRVAHPSWTVTARMWRGGPERTSRRDPSGSGSAGARSVISLRIGPGAYSYAARSAAPLIRLKAACPGERVGDRCTLAPTSSSEAGSMSRAPSVRCGRVPVRGYGHVARRQFR